jgi:hypothetical protein
MFTYKGVTCETIEELKLLMASLDRPTCPQVPQQMPSFPSREWHEDLVERRYQKAEAERVARELRVADKERRRQNLLDAAHFRAEAEEIAKRKEPVLPRHVSVDKDGQPLGGVEMEYDIRAYGTMRRLK